MNARRFSIIAITALMLVLFAPRALWSWGRMGHRVSAILAYSRLTPAAVTAIRDLLEPGEALANISTWADRQREVPNAAPWHYVNVPITESRYDAKFCQPKGCVVSKAEHFRRVLLNPKAARKEKQQALKFLVHFIQDLHQPVHVGDNGDRGGNDLQLRWFNVGANLHSLVDSQVIDRYRREEAQWAQELNTLATKEQTIEWSKGSLNDWATNSLEAAKLLYRQPGSQDLLKSGAKLGDEYYQVALPIARQQLARAGVRVAWMLNQIFR
jgi:nuclease S1